MSKLPPVCDYEGSDYRTRFWENQGRDYEDLVERVALRRLMPPTGSTLIDIGAGFGRYANEFSGYDKVVLFDYSSSLLREARDHLGDDPRFTYVAGNWYEMPFVDGLFQTMVQIRTIHHAANVPGLFDELARIQQTNGRYVLEFANKRNIKSIARYALRKQPWSPFDREPIEFVELNFDFHPKWMREQLESANFAPQTTLAVSHFRLGLLKNNMPVDVLVKADSALQGSGKFLQLSPSVFTLSAGPRHGKIAPADQFFACPRCKQPLVDQAGELECDTCAVTWGIVDGVYDFKEPIKA